MPKYVTDYLTKALICVAEERMERPNAHGGEVIPNCPFCAGNERDLCPPIFVSGDGEIKIVPNKFPVVSERSPEGYGFHEVIIDTAAHMSRTEALPASSIYALLSAVKNRFSFYARNKSIKYIQLFKNQGYRAGASIIHPHWQLIAFDRIPPLPLTIYRRAAEYYRREGTCYICGLLRPRRSHVIREGEGFTIFCPETPRFYSEVWIAPTGHTAYFEELSDERTESLARALKLTLRALGKAFGTDSLNYNILLMDSPRSLKKQASAGCHITLRIVPREGGFAGFELSTGAYINSEGPKETADKLKRAMDEAEM